MAKILVAGQYAPPGWGKMHPWWGKMHPKQRGNMHPKQRGKTHPIDFKMIEFLIISSILRNLSVDWLTTWVLHMVRVVPDRKKRKWEFREKVHYAPQTEVHFAPQWQDMD